MMSDAELTALFTVHRRELDCSPAGRSTWERAEGLRRRVQMVAYGSRWDRAGAAQHSREHDFRTDRFAAFPRGDRPYGFRQFPLESDVKARWINLGGKDDPDVSLRVVHDKA